MKRVRFGECVLDSDTRQLFVRGEAVHLSPKAFQFLELLLESRPKALSKSENPLGAPWGVEEAAKYASVSSSRCDPIRAFRISSDGSKRSGERAGEA